MPPRKPKPFTSTRNPHRKTLNGAAAAEYNGPITRSRALRAHSPTSTIHSLPLEVLSEIFILALPTDQELFSRLESYETEGRYTHLVICAVCSAWRFLAFSTPRLWNSVHIHVPRRGINEAQAQRKAADLVQWIPRSRSLPLTLHISGHFTRKNPDTPIISVINDHAARWESLYSRDVTLSSSLFHLNGWQSLRRLSYPCLDPVSCANDTVPWAHLTHLQIRINIPLRDATMILMKCPKLVYLSITVDPSTIEQSTVPIMLQDLVTFYLELYGGAGLLHQLSLPSLQEFSITKISSTDIESLLDLFTRSSCTLDRLEICGITLTSRDYLNVLAHSSCDSLASLSMRILYSDLVEPVDEELLRRLTLRRNDTLCSHLSSLAIGYCIPACLFSEVLDMAKSRIGSAAGLVPGEPALQCLRLYLTCLENDVAELDKVGQRSGIEYRCQGLGSLEFSVRLRRQGFREPPNFSELFWL